jgi:PAS domain S-box-containing protein
VTRQRASQLAGIAAVTIAGAAFIAWWAGPPLLSDWGQGVPVRPPVAVGLAVLGLALLRPGRDRHPAFAAGLAVAAVAALRLATVLAADALRPGGAPAEPAPAWLQIPRAALLALTLAGGALALSRFRRHQLAATGLAGLAGAIAVLALLGYLTGLDTLFGATSLSLPPLPTAVALLFVVGGISLQIGRMPVLRTPRPLWHLLLALGCATVAPLLLFGAYAGTRMAEAQLDQVRKDLMSEARAVSAEIDRQAVVEIEKLNALAASPSLHPGPDGDVDFVAFQRQAEAALGKAQKSLIILVDRNMDQRVNTSVPYGTPIPKTVLQGPVERAMTTGEPQFTGLFMAPGARRLLFAVVVPVAIDGEDRYALISSPDRRAFRSLIAARELPPGWQIVVTDAEHRILARSGPHDGTIGTALPQAQWNPGGSRGIFAFSGADGRPALQAYAHSELTGWDTAAWEPEAMLEAPVRALWRTLGGMALLTFVLLATLALWLGRQIAGSVAHAANAAAALGAGDPLPAGTTPVAEVNTLMAQLHEAAAHRAAVEHLLRQSEETFRTMFDQSSVAKIEVVPGDGRFLHVNPAMCRFVGYSEAELLDMTVWEITHPDERTRDREPIERLMNGETSEFDVEKRYIRKDGTPVWARTTVNLIRDRQGHPWRDFAVIQDIDARKRAEQALQASKDRLELALDASLLGSWQFDAVRRMFSGDARSKEIFDIDITQDEVPIEQVIGRLHRDDVDKVLHAIAEALDPVAPRRAVNQFRLLRGRGEVRWIETLGHGYFEGSGAERRGVTIVGTCQDITERKEREEKEHLLMREINHRAKNMLSVVHAIAQQTATRNPEDFMALFSERIQALSANQDLLVRNEWNGVEVEDLVRAQLAPFVGLIGSRIAVAGPALRLTAAAAQAIGLALHELATNAGKYGALSTDRGRVDVSWAAGSDTFTMNWTETGGPPVSAPPRRGFGTIVVDTMAARSVGGTVNLDYAPSGVRWRLTCPSVNALEPFDRNGSPGGAAAAQSAAGNAASGNGPVTDATAGKAPVRTDSARTDSDKLAGDRTGSDRMGGDRSGSDRTAIGSHKMSSDTASRIASLSPQPAAGGQERGAPGAPQFNTELRGR